MALQREIWVNSILEALFADNSFAARSVNHNEFVNGKTVHVPNAGAAPSVIKGRSSFPAEVKERSDIDLDYNIEEYTTDPIRIPEAEKVELSYNKRESVIRMSRSKLADSVHNDIVKSWVPASGYTKVATTGAASDAHSPSATGKRKKLVKADVLKLKVAFDKDDIPQTGRCLLLDAVMYNELLESLTESESFAFLNSADATKGLVGKLYGFDVYERSTVLTVVAAGTSLSTSEEATDSAAGIAWHEDFVSRAVGNTDMFDDDKNPLYYGDIVSFLVRAGGKYISADKKGVALIYQATAA